MKHRDIGAIQADIDAATEKAKVILTKMLSGEMKGMEALNAVSDTKSEAVKLHEELKAALEAAQKPPKEAKKG